MQTGRKMMLLAVGLPLLVTLAYGAVAGQKESTAHGGRSPHERFEDEHYKGGQHNEDLDHQAMLGSKKEAEEFDHLTPEESKKRLRKLAEEIDTDHDGFVDRSELTAHIHKSLAELDEEEVKERFDEMDNDKDGKISWNEYKSDAFGDDDDESSLDQDDLNLMEEDKLYFQAADHNGDNSLSRDEFKAFQNPENHPHMHQTLVDLTLKDKDANKDGKIDLNEFIGEAAADSEWTQTEKDRFANEYDLNKDGSLDQEEMKRWLVPDIHSTAKEESDHLFSEADADHDDKLSMDEIVNEHQLFVGSEATNYGDHLNRIEL